MRSHTIPMPEGSLHVLASGDSGPPVLLLSGGGIDSALLSWKHMIPALSRDHVVIAPDWPKQGRSRPWNGVADHDRLLGCIDAVLDRFGIATAALVGLSQGGALALDYAIRRPQRVERLVAIAPAGTIAFPPGLHQLLWLAAKLPWLVSLPTRLLMRDRRMVAAFARRALLPGPVADFEDVVEEIRAEVIAGGGGASDWQNRSIGFLRMNIDLRPMLHRIRCPVLFIQGDRDVGVKPRRTVEAAALVPDARLELLPGHGHWPNRQSPDLVNPLVADFLQDARGRL